MSSKSKMTSLTTRCGFAVRSVGWLKSIAENAELEGDRSD
jgi:hypothetical protein